MKTIMIKDELHQQLKLLAVKNQYNLGAFVEALLQMGLSEFAKNSLQETKKGIENKENSDK